MDFDPASVTGFQWDSGNDVKNSSKHRVSCAEAEEVFLNRPIVAEDIAHSLNERRWHALGHSAGGRLLHITFTIRGALLRVISARPMNRKEQMIYVAKKK